MFGERPVTTAGVRFGTVALHLLKDQSFKCNSAPFFPRFAAEQVFVQIAPSRSSNMTGSMLQAVAVWLEWANSTGFSACVETSGQLDKLRVNIRVNVRSFLLLSSNEDVS